MDFTRRKPHKGETQNFRNLSYTVSLVFCLQYFLLIFQTQTVRKRTASVRNKFFFSCYLAEIFFSPIPRKATIWLTCSPLNDKGALRSHRNLKPALQISSLQGYTNEASISDCVAGQKI